MGKSKKSFDKLIISLEERVRELNCTFEIEELLALPDITVKKAFQQLVEIIPKGWQYSEICTVRLTHRDKSYISSDFQESPWTIEEKIIANRREVGSIEVFYAEEKPQEFSGPFIEDEVHLLKTIATRLSHFLIYQKLKMVFNKWENTKNDIADKNEGEWQIVLELLRRTDPDLYIRIARKMLNHLIWSGIGEAELVLQAFNPTPQYQANDVLGESNSPLPRWDFDNAAKVSNEAFKLAIKHLKNADILSKIQKWMQQDKTAFLVRATTNNDTSLTEIADAIHKYYQISPEGLELMPSTLIGVRAALIRRFFSEQLEFVNIAKNYVHIIDFNELLKTVIFPTSSHGKLGGKSAGIFLAKRILEKNVKDQSILKHIKMPKTWYITSDALIQFMHFNNLEEIMEQKYKDIDEIRKEYPHIVQLFKSSHFPPEIVKGLSVALDDFGDHPLIVRSSSLLEDRLGAAFSGKYKSLFLANQGNKAKRLERLMDAIAEVYASTIGPDPIEYRSERGLIDFHEEMGILIQQVVGKKVGKYFLPAFAGVAFSNNEFRWSPRIHREDGLLRIVPGLGTRAVDRVSDDFPTLIAPGQHGLRANVSINEIVRYSPQKADVINLETSKFETVEIQDLFHKYGNEYPFIQRIVSVFEHNNIRKPVGLNTDFTKEDLIVTFDGLIQDSPFINIMNTMLTSLQAALATPVDLEFASTGDDIYLLQCRPQSYSKYDAPSPIPSDIPEEQILFFAHKYISNGLVPQISHIVYVDPAAYSAIEDHAILKKVGIAVGRLNAILPKRKFILMGPGRWGSRGDIKLGVNVTYSDINNCSVLIEIARKKGNYVPDLSFGTHFFQDLVEASIRYLPLYPDEDGAIFKEDFFMSHTNFLSDLLPEFAALQDFLKVIDVEEATGGNMLHILMNADLETAIAILAPESGFKSGMIIHDSEPGINSGAHSEWRQKITEKMAAQLDPTRFGVQAMYLAGSSKDKTAQPGSDIDLMIRFNGTQEQKAQLRSWLEGWSLALDLMNFYRTGIKCGGLLDVHFYSDLKDKKNLSNMKRLILAVPKKNA